jgi:F-type H+-transporting ATPase subunit delta
MPRSPVAARRYAQAFFELTEKSREALVELRAFSEVLQTTPQVSKFFLSPVISSEEKTAALSEIRKHFPLSILFFESLIELNRMDNLSGIADEFERLCDERSGELSVEVESATTISESALDDVRALLQEKWKKKLKLRTSVNPDLIGGFVARAPGKLFDASVVSQLESLQEQIFS